MGSMISERWQLFAAVFYLLGFVTPLIVLRSVIRDRDDGCVLNLAIVVIIVVIIILVVVMVAAGP
ncbi:MAG: hypothetical protein KDD92_18925 [Caldilineaceae bacterium]|nr:hypothetical protein [Caldilineaceae bacterium]